MSKDSPKLQLSGSHGKHVSGGKDIFEFYQWALNMSLKDVAHLIKQDVLIVMGTRGSPCSDGTSMDFSQSNEQCTFYVRSNHHGTGARR